MRNFIKRNEKRMNIISKGIVGIFNSFVFMVVVPAIQDFPSVMSENYLEVEGIVTTWDYSDEENHKQELLELWTIKQRKKYL